MLFHDDALIPIAASQTLLLNEQSRALESQGRKLFKFGFGQSPFSPPEHVIEALKDNADQHAYSPVQGLCELREAVASFHSHIDGLDIDENQVFIAPGSKILIYNALACFKKANVFIPSPAWVSYAPQAHMLGHDVHRVETFEISRWRVTADQLDQSLALHNRADTPAILILNYPGNPDGLSYSEDELSALSDVIKKHEVLVISDEIYGVLHHDGEHKSIAHACPDQTIITTGLSKWCGAGGWRLGAAILPKAFENNLQPHFLGVASETYSCAPTPVQWAAMAAYGNYEQSCEFVKHERRILKSVGSQVCQILQAAGIKVHAPEGGFYLFPDFSPFQDQLGRLDIATSQALCQKLLKETGVVLLPSDAFGMDDAHLSARLAYVDFDGNEALNVSKALGLNKDLSADFAEHHASHTINGAKALAEWMSNLS